jgi:hypothetical protein
MLETPHAKNGRLFMTFIGSPLLSSPPLYGLGGGITRLLSSVAASCGAFYAERRAVAYAARKTGNVINL